MLVQSPNVLTYVNAIAALCAKHPAVTTVKLVFLSKDVDEKFVDEIQRKLSLLSDSPSYAKGARVYLSGEIGDYNDVSLAKNWDVVDVTGVSKDVAIQVAAAAINNKKTRICQLSWNKQFAKGEAWVVEEGNHSYNDLMSVGALSKLYDNYFQKKQVLFVFLVLFSVVFFAAVAKIIWPKFGIPNDLVNLLSLLIGAAGLYLAAISVRGSHA